MRSRRPPPNILLIRVDGEDDPKPPTPTPSSSKVKPSSTTLSSPLPTTPGASASFAAAAQLSTTATPPTPRPTTPVTPSPTTHALSTSSAAGSTVDDDDLKTVTVTAAPQTVSLLISPTITIAPTSTTGTAMPLADSSLAVPGNIGGLSQTAVDVLIVTGTLATVSIAVTISILLWKRRARRKKQAQFESLNLPATTPMADSAPDREGPIFTVQRTTSGRFLATQTGQQSRSQRSSGGLEGEDGLDQWHQDPEGEPEQVPAAISTTEETRRHASDPGPALEREFV